MPLAIGDHELGPQRAWVIAEAGINHNGSTDAALGMVGVAHEAGADAIKFQVFSAERLVSPGAPTADYQRQARAGADQRELLRRVELSHDEYGRIAQHCHQVGIEFLATPFDALDLQFLLTLRVPAIKIASTDLTNRPLLEAAFASGLPVLLSTGAALRQEIDQAVAWYRRARESGGLVLLHCVSSYPTPPEAANLRAIGTLYRRYGLPVGYSDHTTSRLSGALALAAGACLIEKHFSLDSHLPGPDQAMSLEPAALAEYIARIRQSETLMGTGRLGCAEVEKDVRRVARRSIVAQRDIAAGQTLTREMLAAKRPAGGIDPARFQDILGWRAARDIPRDSALSWQMLQPQHPDENQPAPARPAEQDSLPELETVRSGATARP